MSIPKNNNELDIFQAKLLKNPAYKKAWEDASPFMQIAREITHARLEAGLTQKQLAERLGTTQSAIARLESLDYEKVKVHTLQRVAEALGLELNVSFRRPGKPRPRKQTHFPTQEVA